MSQEIFETQPIERYLADIGVQIAYAANTAYDVIQMMPDEEQRAMVQERFDDIQEQAAKFMGRGTLAGKFLAACAAEKQA